MDWPKYENLTCLRLFTTTEPPAGIAGAQPPAVLREHAWHSQDFPPAQERVGIEIQSKSAI